MYIPLDLTYSESLTRLHYPLVTRDPEYMELEKQFKLLSQNAQRLQTDAETYRDGVAGMIRYYTIDHVNKPNT
jgi:hypothetical protein